MVRNNQNKNKPLLEIASGVLWLLVWQGASLLIGEALFLPAPLSVISALVKLMSTTEFFYAVGFSFQRIGLGFLLAALVGTGLAIIAYKLYAVEILLRPPIGAVKSAPVASFVVIALLMVGSKNLSVLISFLMVLPIFYSNVLFGLHSVEPERFEAAAVFGMLNRDRFRFIYLPFVAPFFSSACQVGIGIAWKAGVSAEVIGITAGSIGGKLYDAKLSINMDEVFAYTLVVILISLLFEKLSVLLIHYIEKKLTD